MGPYQNETNENLRNKDSCNSRKVTAGQAWMTHFRSLFGTGFVALPNLLSSTGLPLGVALYLLIVITCVFALWTLFEACAIVENPAYPRLNRSKHIVNERVGSNHHDGIKITYRAIINHEYESQVTIKSSDKNEHDAPQILTYEDLATAILGPWAGTSIRVAVVFVYLSLAVMAINVLQDILERMFHTNRFAVAAVLFPIACALSQIPQLQDMWLISALSLLICLFGVIGSTMYTAIFEDVVKPADVWEFRWHNSANFMMSSLFGLENAGLALPTAKSMAEPDKGAMIVLSSTVTYGLILVTYASVAYYSGVGGYQVNDGCAMVTDCISPIGLRNVVEMCMAITCVLSMAIFFFPAFELLEYWLLAKKGNNKQLSGEIVRQKEVLLFPSESSRTSVLLNESHDAVGLEKNMTLRIYVAFLAILIGTVTNDYALMTAFAGSIGMTYAGIILPAVLYYVAMSKSKKEMSIVNKLIVHYLFVFGILSMILGFYFSLGALFRGGF